MTAVEVIHRAAHFGLKLGIEPPDILTLQPANRCSVEFANTLRAYKPQLLTLLQLPFCVVYSRALGETICFCEDEATRAAFVKVGTEESSIYTRAELQILVEHNRAHPFIPDELLRLHRAKRTLNTRLAK